RRRWKCRRCSSRRGGRNRRAPQVLFRFYQRRRTSQMMNGEETTAALVAAFGDDEETALERLRARLAVRAEAKGILDVAYRTLDSPAGTLLLIATELGLVRVAFSIEDHDAVLG